MIVYHYMNQSRPTRGMMIIVTRSSCPMKVGLMG